jgi:hypothetical protein
LVIHSVHPYAVLQRCNYILCVAIAGAIYEEVYQLLLCLGCHAGCCCQGCQGCVEAFSTLLLTRTYDFAAAYEHLALAL